MLRALTGRGALPGASGQLPLRPAAATPRPARPVDEPELAFYEAYFSNFIEGTEFELDEARDIVTTRATPPARPADAHDVLGTYEIVVDLAEMSRVAHTAADLADLLIARHRHLMAWRPEKRPGLWKSRANRAGATNFVAPELVLGTLAECFTIGSILTGPSIGRPTWASSSPRRTLERTGAFVSPLDTERRGVRLQLPGEARGADVSDLAV